MDHQRLSDDLIYPKATGKKRHFCISTTGQQWRQISGMIRMETSGRVIMSSGFLEIFSAAPTFMNMKCKKSIPWQSLYMSADQYSTASLVKPYHSC